MGQARLGGVDVQVALFQEHALIAGDKGGLSNSTAALPANERSQPISSGKPITKQTQDMTDKNQKGLWFEDDRGLSLHRLFIQSHKEIIKRAI